MYRKYFKRALDFISASIIFILLSPLFIVLALFLSVTLKGNPFFTQRRPGRDGRIFRLMKFRSMNNRRDADGNLLPAKERVTHIGRIMRKTSLDELPQLVNVIAGDMSLIGPRPLREEYLPYYTPEQNRRHSVRPGITGWAQVNGRTAMSWDEKFKLDVWYVDNLNFMLDCRIAFMTVKNLFDRSKINEVTENFSAPFKGVKLDS